MKISCFKVCTILTCSYHQKVPTDPPALEMKATYGLASPVEFQMPSHSPLWTPVAYAAIDAPRSPSDPANSVSPKLICVHSL